MDTQWLKAAQENFREAISQKNWDMAKAIISDVWDNGFTSERLDMNAALRRAMDREPSAPHGYILGFLKKKNEEYKAKGLIPTIDMLIEDLTG